MRIHSDERVSCEEAVACTQYRGVEWRVAEREGKRGERGEEEEEEAARRLPGSHFSPKLLVRAKRVCLVFSHSPLVCRYARGALCE